MGISVYEGQEQIISDERMAGGGVRYLRKSRYAGIDCYLGSNYEHQQKTRMERERMGKRALAAAARNNQNLQAQLLALLPQRAHPQLHVQLERLFLLRRASLPPRLALRHPLLLLRLPSLPTLPARPVTRLRQWLRQWLRQRSPRTQPDSLLLRLAPQPRLSQLQRLSSLRRA